MVRPSLPRSKEGLSHRDGERVCGDRAISEQNVLPFLFGHLLDNVERAHGRTVPDKCGEVLAPAASTELDRRGAIKVVQPGLSRAGNWIFGVEDRLSVAGPGGHVISIADVPDEVRGWAAGQILNSNLTGIEDRAVGNAGGVWR